MSLFSEHEGAEDAPARRLRGRVRHRPGTVLDILQDLRNPAAKRPPRRKRETPGGVAQAAIDKLARELNEVVARATKGMEGCRSPNGQPFRVYYDSKNRTTTICTGMKLVLHMVESVECEQQPDRRAGPSLEIKLSLRLPATHDADTRELAVARLGAPGLASEFSVKQFYRRLPRFIALELNRLFPPPGFEDPEV